MIVSSLYPRFRDIGDHLDASRSTALFYATPVLYPLEIVSGTLRELIALNPLAPIFELARKWVIDPDAPGPGRGRGRRRVAARPGRRSSSRSACSRCGSSTARRRGSPRSCEARARGRRGRRRASSLGWLGVMERDIRLQARGVAAPSRDVAGDFARAEARLPRRAAAQPRHRAGPAAARSLYQARGRPRRGASRCSRTCVRREPDNLTAWGVLYAFTRERDPATARAGAAPRARAARIRSRARLTSLAARSARRRATTAGSVTAGQLPVPVDRRVQEPDERAPRPGRRRPRGSRRSASRAASATPPASSAKREQADEAELGGHLELERVRVADRLGDRALLQPDDAEAARADAGQRLVARTRAAPTRQYS